MSVNKLGIILFSSFLIFAIAPLASAQSTQDQTQDQTKKTQKGTAKKETGKTATDKNAPADDNKTGTTEKTEAGKTGVKKAKKTSSLSTDKVREVQMNLKNEGFDPGPIDGVLGPMTMTALRNYQSHSKLAVTGTLTPETENALLHGATAGTARQGALNSRSSLEQDQQTYGQDQQQTYSNGTDQANQSPGAASEPAATSVEDVKQIQIELTDLNYNPGDINGMMTTDTQEAIRQFQWFNDLPVTGIVDEQTKISLETQSKGGTENAELGQTPLSAEREKPSSEVQQNRADSYNKDQKTTTDNTYNQDQADHSKHDDQATGKHEKDAADRIAKAAAVLHELTTSADNRIPNDLLERAEAIVVIPHMVKGALGIGGRYGKGVVSERTENGRWSPPAFMDIGGGSFGLQIGASATDLVLVFTDRKALDMLEKGKDLKLGVDAGVVAGPIGREAEAGTNAKLESSIYAYSRSKGLFAGIALDGAILYMDNDMNRKVYGDSVDSKQILSGNVPMKSVVRPFMDELERVIPKKRISQK
jgi:lipid-binding SYLF domain-containing protein/peptidoglycan hydrolase-like protein with peptidoglycan-binding domain